MMDFNDLVRAATSHDPYPYQQQLAQEGLPELLSVPTGSGKTIAAVLPWLYRRRFHPDEAIRSGTPRRLVFVLPMRVLAEQTVGLIRLWLSRLGLEDEVGCDLLMGGEPRTAPWRVAPEQDMVIVGTMDMIVSRALNRGYGESRYLWPIDFGLFNADCHFVFDEVQLMGPALATSRQLHGLRGKLGTASPCTSTWMSATVPHEQMATFDAPHIDTTVTLGEADIVGPLAMRLAARKHVEELVVADPKKSASVISASVRAQHRAGSLSLVLLNTIERARAVAAALGKAQTAAEVVLLHSRFRPDDRQRLVERALAPFSPDGPGRIVVSTQVVEAGVDISADLLVTEAAPWPSIIQRAGRCNRDGRSEHAKLIWLEPPSPAPYEQSDVDGAVGALRALEGSAVTSAVLSAQQVPVKEEIQPVLRRKDLVDLFDTLPDLSGNDIDVARFIRDSQDLDVSVAWRLFGPEGPEAGEPLPGRAERCPAPVGEVRKMIKDRSLTAWRFDHLSSGWAPCVDVDIRPGVVLLLRSVSGCYSADAGWDRSSTAPVEPVAAARAEDLAGADDRATGDDPASNTPGRWMSLADHLVDAGETAAGLVAKLTPTGLTEAQRRAAVNAARLHDIGKAHPVFQDSLRRTLAEGETIGDDVVLAKSGTSTPLRHSRRNFRHELVSALMLLGEGSTLLADVEEPELVTYLVAAHHGRVRMGFRPLPDEGTQAGQPVALGVRNGDIVPPVMTHDGPIAACVMDLGFMSLGDRDSRESWSARALKLRDRADLGPFRLGYLEALVRSADWVASARSVADLEEARRG